jgi:hypothetical protein
MNLSPAVRNHLVEPDVPFEHALVALLDVEVGEERGDSVVSGGTHREVVQMAVRPPHRGLEDVVQPVEGQVAGDLEPPPDRRPGAVEVDTQPVRRDGLGHRTRLGLAAHGQPVLRSWPGLEQGGHQLTRVRSFAQRLVHEASDQRRDVAGPVRPTCPWALARERAARCHRARP